MANVVAIVGRPNVGKSTLYNRLIGERNAIVDDLSGVTRDRLYGTCEWNGKNFTVIDTGGFVPSSSDVFEVAIRNQVHIAIEEASVIVFMVDVTTGITDLDEEVAQALAQNNQNRWCLAVNKVDNHARVKCRPMNFGASGFEDTLFVSSITGTGGGEILDAITDHLAR